MIRPYRIDHSQPGLPGRTPNRPECPARSAKPIPFGPIRNEMTDHGATTIVRDRMNPI